MKTANPIIKDALCVLGGSACVAAALVIFTIPNDIAPGGVSGLATALRHITPISTGLWALIINLPLFIFALRRLGLRPLIKTAAATILLSVFIDLFSLFLPVYTNNTLVSAVYGGALMGLGVGLLFIRGASTGGTDLLSLIMSSRFPDVSMGTILLLIDGAVVVVAVIIFRDIDVALYSTAAIFVSSKVVDSIMQGADFAKVIYVVTTKGNALAAALMEKVGRGVTLSCVTGGFTGEKKYLLTLVLRRNSVSKALATIKEADRSAFIYVVSSTEVHGEGFK